MWATRRNSSTPRSLKAAPRHYRRQRRTPIIRLPPKEGEAKLREGNRRSRLQRPCSDGQSPGRQAGRQEENPERDSCGDFAVALWGGGGARRGGFASGHMTPSRKNCDEPLEAFWVCILSCVGSDGCICQAFVDWNNLQAS